MSLDSISYVLEELSLLFYLFLKKAILLVSLNTVLPGGKEMEQIIIFTLSLPFSSSKYQHDSGLVSHEKKSAIGRIYYVLAFYGILLDIVKISCMYRISPSIMLFKFYI